MLLRYNACTKYFAQRSAKNAIFFSLKIQIQTCIWQGLLLIVGFEKKIGQATLTYVPILVVCICTRITVLACCAARMGEIFSERVFVLKNLYLLPEFLFKKFAVFFLIDSNQIFLFGIERKPAWKWSCNILSKYF